MCVLTDYPGEDIQSVLEHCQCRDGKEIRHDAKKM